MINYLLKPSQVDHFDSFKTQEPNLELVKLEEGELVLSISERKQLAEELSTHYVSYNKPELRELVKKICRIIP